MMVQQGQYIKFSIVNTYIIIGVAGGLADYITFAGHFNKGTNFGEISMSDNPHEPSRFEKAWLEECRKQNTFIERGNLPFAEEQFSTAPVEDYEVY